MGFARTLQILIFLLMICSLDPVGAAEQEVQPKWGEKVWENVKSPFTTKAREALLLGGAVLVTILVFEDQIIDPAQEESIENKPLGKLSHFGDLAGQMYPNALYVVGMLGYGLIESDRDALGNSSSMFQATAYSAAVTTALKYAVREPRPNNPDRKNSFPSGHATTAFAFAAYIGCRHSLPWGIAAYSMAGLVAYSRMNDNAHFMHDVVGGATIGEAYGLGICHIENQRNGLDGAASKVSWAVAPFDEGAMGQLSLTY